MRSIKCPHCGHVALIRTSRPLTKLIREAKCQCTNLDCGHTFVVLAEIVHTISPSACPDPSITAQLKQSKRGKELYGDGPAG